MVLSPHPIIAPAASGRSYSHFQVRRLEILFEEENGARTLSHKRLIKEQIHRTQLSVCNLLEFSFERQGTESVAIALSIKGITFIVNFGIEALHWEISLSSSFDNLILWCNINFVIHDIIDKTILGSSVPMVDTDEQFFVWQKATGYKRIVDSVNWFGLVVNIFDNL